MPLSAGAAAISGRLPLLLKKNPNVRIVLNAITLETNSEILSCLKEYAFVETEAVTLTVSKAQKLGNYHLMWGQNPVTIWTCQRGTIK
jgi:precorrin-6Y C5,15-methyltransferase (decarboxylating)